jgi:immune inhibitor A
MLKPIRSLAFQAVMIAFVLSVIAGPADAGLRLTAYSGSYMWYSGRGMNINHVMSHEFPVPAGGATLTFMTWYDIQTHWDYGFVGVSTDGGFTWTALEGNITTSDDPNGNNSEGFGVTGKSGGWVAASFDLSAHAGQDVILRFRYETDGSVAYPGWAIDDIVIGEVGFFDDVEYGYGDWTHTGWDITDGFLKTRMKAKKLESPPSSPKRRVVDP